MRGFDQRHDGLFSYVRPESRIPKTHPLRVIRTLADQALASLDDQFAALYSENGRPSIPPEQLLRALLSAPGADGTTDPVGRVLQRGRNAVPRPSS